MVKVKENGYEYLMLVEFQTRTDREMAERLLEYTAIHHRRYGKPVYPVVINLTGRGRWKEQYIIDCLDLTVIDFNFRQINLEEVFGRELLYRGPVELLPLAPLMRHDDPLEVVLEKCANRLNSEVKSQAEKDILYTALAALSSLKLPKDIILKVLEVSAVETLPLFDGVREKWKSVYLAEGEAKGKAEGETKGRLEVAKNLLLLNMDIDTIVKATGLEKTKIVELEKQIRQQELKEN